MAANLLQAASIPPPKLRSLDHVHDNAQTPAAISLRQPKQRLQPTEFGLSVLGKPIGSTSYASILDACTCPNLGKQLHGHSIKCGFHGHEFVEAKLLQMYGRCGCLDDAVDLFDEMPLRNLHAWTAIMNVHLDHELYDDAVSLFFELLVNGTELEFFVFPVALKICSGLGDLNLGGQLHGRVIKSQFLSNIYVGNALIDMYGKCGSLDSAQKVLETMDQRDCVSWNSIVTACIANGMVYEGLSYLDEMVCSDNLMPNLVSWSAVIGGFSQNGYDEEAIDLLPRMLDSGLRPNARTLASILPSCARLRDLHLGREIHGYVIRHGFMSNAYVVNGLVDVYRRCSDMRSALKMFSRFSVQNEVSYNTMIVGYCESGNVWKAKELFDSMEVEGIEKGIVSWNSMISGFADNALFDEALRTYHCLAMEGVVPDSFTLGSVLVACTDSSSLKRGKEIHSQAIVRGLQSNPFVGGALVEMYCKCQDLVAAQLAFDQVSERDIATWNALISGYSRCNEIEKIHRLLSQMKEDGFEPNIYTWNSILAGYMEMGSHEMVMRLLSQMQSSNIRPDIFTTGMIVTACSKLATIERGKQVHAYSIKHGYESDVHIGVALVDMYAKCGSIKDAVFSYGRITNPNLVSHNAMLMAYAMHGLGEEGIALFGRMSEQGYKPDHVTFLSALSSCVHAGEVELGRELFNIMAYHQLNPTIKHYTCMVDLLSRAGQLNEAYDLVKGMPMEPDSVVWSALLGGCVISGNVELGEIAAQRLIELEPENTSNYILLANLYAFVGKWHDLAGIRRVMKDRGMHKIPGCSWIEDRDEVHVFLACDRSHEKTDEIYTALENLTVHMKKFAELVS